MTDRRFQFWQRWLFWASVSAAVVGVVLCFLDTRTAPWFAKLVNESVWGQAVMPEPVVPYHRFTHAVLGATVASWGTMMAFVAHFPFKRREPWAWWCIASALIVWFPLDTAMSLALGVWPNAVVNTGAVLVMVVPLVFTRSIRHRPGESRSGTPTQSPPR